jgi:hypothetical protein
MGEASLQRVRSNYLDWDSKVDRIVEIFEETLAAQKKDTSVKYRLPTFWNNSNLVEQ